MHAGDNITVSLTWILYNFRYVSLKINHKKGSRIIQMLFGEKQDIYSFQPYRSAEQQSLTMGGITVLSIYFQVILPGALFLLWIWHCYGCVPLLILILLTVYTSFSCCFRTFQLAPWFWKKSKHNHSEHLYYSIIISQEKVGVGFILTSLLRIII